MIPTTTPPALSPPATPAHDGLADVFAQLQGLYAAIVTLDPREAALRAGLSLLVLIVALVILFGVKLLLDALISRLTPATEEQAATRNLSFRSWTMLVARIAVAVIALLMVMQIWGLSLAAMLAGPVGAVLIVAGRAALIVVLMLGVIELSNAAIRRVFARVAARAKGPRRGAQLRTIAPVVSGFISAVLFVIAAMMLLAQIGVEIGPLLAGAGIVGLAVGFGAQTLVKDFLTGIFLIVEDVVSIGDVVKIGDAAGLVEDMSLRTIKLRAFDGTLQVIPYGEAQIIHNMTKDFSYYVFNISISYSSDIGKALEVMKQVGDELKQDARFGQLMLEPIEILGVDQLADSGVILKARIKTLPIQQWTVGREYLKRIKLAFDTAHVEIPFPHVKLVPPDQPIQLDEHRPRAAD